MVKGSTDRTAVLDGVRHKLAPPKFLDKAQISSVVQSFRQGSKDPAQLSPTLKLGSSDPRPRPTQNNLRLSSVKGKKGAARSRNFNGDQGSVDQGVPSSNRIDLNQSQVGSDRAGTDGHRVICDGQGRFGSDGITFTADMGSLKSGPGELGFRPSRVSSEMDQCGGFLQSSNQGSMESEQTGVVKGVDYKGFSPSGDSIAIEGMHAAGEVSTSNSSSTFAMQCAAKEGCETEGMELEVRGALEDPQC